MPLHIDHFGFIAPVFERIVPSKVPEELLALADIQPGNLVLDAGGGTGRIAVYACRAGARTVVADPSLLMLREAKKKAGLLLVNTPIELAPFSVGCFDRILMVDALHHVASQEDAAASLWRLLKPGGRIVIEEPDYHHWLSKLVALGENLLLMGSRFLTPEQITGLFAFQGARAEVHISGPIARIVVVRMR